MRFSTMVVRSAAAAAFAGGLLLLGAAPAQAQTTIPINPGNVPTTAADFGTHECTQTGSSPDLDGWVFVLPGNKGSFVSVTATFATPGGTVQLTIPTDGGAIGGTGNRKAWITTPAGWTLIDATAVIEGQSNGFFVLTHTCPAVGTPTPSPSSSSPSESPSSSPPSTPPTSESTSSSAAALLVGAGGTPLGAAVGLLFTCAVSTGAVLVMRRRRDRLG
jgi:hypothetical protein